MKRLLTNEQRVMLKAAMEAAFGTLQQLDGFLQLRLGRGIDSYSRGVLPETILAVIVRSEASLLTLKDLLTKLEQHTPNEFLKIVASGILEQLPKMKYELFETNDPCQTLFPGDRPYFNRHKVRVRFGELVAPNVTRTLAIHGAPGSGKTYAGQLVLHIQDRVNPPFEHAWIDLEDDPTFGYDAEKFMRNIGLRMRLDVTTVPQQATIAELLGWFVGRLNERTELWWLVIDGISKVELSAAVRGLLRLMVKEADRLAHLRLILLGCSDPGILSAGERVCAEEIEPLDDEDITDFLAVAFQRSRVPITKDAIGALAKLVVQEPLPEDGHSRRRLIEQRIESAVLRQKV